MTTRTYDVLWHKAMRTLHEQLVLEDPTINPDSKDVPTVELQPQQAFQHWRAMYIKYCQIYQDLERCYEGVIQPQKRIDIQNMIEAVITRLAELHYLMVQWNPLNPEVAAATPGKPFPWEYINYDDTLMELKLQPEVLELPVPRHFVDRQAAMILKREAVIQEYMQLKLGVDKVLVELASMSDLDAPSIPLTVAEAIAILQRNERGRQGRMRAAVWKERRAEEAKQPGIAGPGNRPRRGPGNVVVEEEEAMSAEDAAVRIQCIFRGYRARCQVQHARRAELVFIGMTDARRPRLEALETAMAEVVHRRNLDQQANWEAYETALEDLHRIVIEEEGSEIKDKMRAERTTWFTRQLAQGVLPEDLSAYYAMLQAPTAAEAAAKLEAETKEADAEADLRGKGGKTSKQQPADKGGKDRKGKGKGKGDDEEVEAEKPPPITGPTPWTKATELLLRAYDATWVGREGQGGPLQRHDEELAREAVRPRVADVLRLQVDAEINDQLANFKMMAAAAKSKKDKKPKKKKEKKSKKKEKPLPGAKACTGMDSDHMLSILVENRIVNNPRSTATFAAYIGGVNLLGSRYSQTDTPAQRHPVHNHWVPPDPSMAQIRESLLHYGVFILGSSGLRQALHEFCGTSKIGNGRLPRSLLLYGPHGAGKTHLAQAVANAAGALFINLSAGNTEGKFAEKGGATKLLHMAFEVAKDQSFGPAVVYIDEIEKLLPAGGGKKKTGGGEAGAGRFKKDLPTYVKSLTVDTRVIVIASSSEPWEGDHKALMDCFDRHIYVPCPDYGTRLSIWRQHVAAALASMPSAASSASIVATAFASGSGPEGADGLLVRPTAEGSEPASDLKVRALAALPLLPSSSALATVSPSEVMDELNFTILAHVSNGYTTGAIMKAIRAVLTPRRLERLSQRPLTESELLQTLSRCPRVYADESDKFHDFMDRMTGLAARRIRPEVVDPKSKKDKKGRK